MATLVDAIADLAYLKDMDGRYLAVNAPAARFFGLQVADILGKDDFALLPEADARRIFEFDRRVLATGIAETYEEQMKDSAGTLRWFQTIKSPCRNPSGEIVGVVGTSRDITDNKLLAETLRQREATLARAERTARLGTWRWTRHPDEVVWSDEIYRIFGIDPDHQPPDRPREPMNYRQLMAREGPPSMRRLIEAFDRAVRFGEPYSLDMEVPRPDGTVEWIVATCEVEQWEDGQVASLCGTVRQITERKLNEARLALSENRYRSLVHATSQIVWTTHADGRQMNTIPAWQAFTGQSDAEVLHEGWSAAIHPEDRDQVIRAWKEAVANGMPYRVEERVRRHDGVYRTMAVSAVPVRDSAGTIVEWVGTHTDITEQQQARQELERAHHRLQDVFDSITDGLCVLDRDLRYIFYNENGARITGMKASDIIGKRLGDLYPENKSNVFGETYRRALATGETIHFEEFQGPPLNKWFECNCYPSAHGLTVYFRDITERRNTEEALRKSESRYRGLFDSNMIGVGRPDRHGFIHHSNAELQRITGYTREEIDAGEFLWTTHTPPEYANIDAQHIAEAYERGSCTPYEKEYLRKDGTRVPVLCGYASVEGPPGEFIGFVIDLSRQRAAEAALRDREQRFQLLAENLPELVWVADPIGSLTYLSPRFLNYCGIPPEEMVGYEWTNFLHPDEVSRVLREWTQVVATGEPYLIELRLRRHDGTFRYFLARALAHRNDQGEIERWVGSCTDIHDQKLSEEALRRSEKLAATGRLAASIAHEINNPLSSVINAIFLALQDDTLTDETRGFLNTAEEELARVSHITTQTLRFHRQSKAAAYADLSDIMRSILGLFRARLMARQIDVQTEFAKSAHLCCFEDELRQVFANMISNALDAMHDRGRLRIRVINVATAGRKGVRVSVADTGSGIPPEIRQRIFEPFFSTKDTTGIGLGLWVSDGILRKHGAHLRLRSSTHPEHHGTVFTLFFPEDGVALHEQPTSFNA